jgi:hypothetical protein
MATFKNALGRLLISLIALSSAGWAAFFFHNLDTAVHLNSVANAILSGSGFKRSPVPEVALAAAETRSICNPLEIRARRDRSVAPL